MLLVYYFIDSALRNRDVVQSPKRHSTLLQSQQQDQRVKRRCLKPVMLIKLFGSVMQGMHQHSTDARMLRHQRTTPDSILQQRGTQFDALGALVSSQPGQNHHRNRVRHIAPYSRGGKLMRHRACRQGVVAKHDLFRIDHHKGTAGTAELVGVSAPDQAGIQLRLRA